MRSLLEIRGAREHNLRGVDLDLPRDGMIGLAGVSGSGKSSLAIDTLFREGQRRYLQTLSPRARRFARAIDGAAVDRITGLRPAIAVDQRSRAFSKRSTVASLTEIHDLLAALFARFGVPHCPACACALAPQSAERISERICSEAVGRRALVLAPLVLEKRKDLPALVERLRALGLARLRIDGRVARLEEELELPSRGVPRVEAVVDRVVPDPAKRARVHEAVVQALELSKGFVGLACEEGPEHLYATARACPSCRIDLPALEPALFSFHGARGACTTCRGRGESSSGELCAACSGTRLRAEARAVRWKGRGFGELLALCIEEAAPLWRELALEERELEAGEAPFRGIGERLELLLGLGLGHLPLARGGRALSGGEAQRVRLAAQIGAHLRDVLYVLDEPSTGLHPSEVDRVIDALRALRDRGNTLLVVEHDLRLLRAMDWLVELGPGAGADGGRVVASGPPSELAASASSATGRALNGAYSHADRARDFDAASAPRLVLRGARGGVLQGDELSLPLGGLVALCGLSGSGKSTLALRTLVPALARALEQSEAPALPFEVLLGHEQLARVVSLDAAPLARSARSDVATLCGLAPLLRERLAETPEARWRGYAPQRFSAQVSEKRGGGRCEACRGMGVRELELARGTTLPSSCEACGGSRFAPATREVRFGGLDIAGWLALRVDEAAERLRDQVAARRVLEVLRRLGLGYLALGQRARDLSGGELQRLRLAAELARPAAGRTLYVLDEPTRGLHAADIRGLLEALYELVDRGDSVLVVEHDEQVLRSAQWLIEMGPGSGARGGRIVARGTPAELAVRAETPTGRFLGAPAALDPVARAEAAARPAAELRVRGARRNNLRALEARFPLGALSVITGPSGSGKSTLLFDIVHAEGRRRFLESLGAGARKRLGTLARAPHDGVEGLGPTLAVDARDGAGEAGRDVADLGEIASDLSRYFARVATPHCPEHGEPLGPIDPTELARSMAARWAGAKGYLCVPWPRQGEFGSERELLVAQGFLRALVDGAELRLDEASAPAPAPGARVELVLDRVSFEERAIPRVVEAIEAARRTQRRRVVFVQRARDGARDGERCEFDLDGACSRCGTAVPAAWNERSLAHDERWAKALRLARDPLEPSVALREILALPFSELASEIARERIRARAAGGARARAAEAVLPQLDAKLKTLVDLGLGHLDAARDAATLSSGELRRLRLVAATAAGLDGLCVVLDEPSVGLHARDLDALWNVLRGWRNAGNTLLVIEHAEELIERADHVLELGPGAGAAGGRCVASGTPLELRSAATATGRALRGELFAAACAAAPRSERLQLRGVRTRTLQGLDFELEAGRITAVSGVSGAGKSSLLLGTLVPAFERARALAPSSEERSALARWETLQGAESFEALCVVDDRPLTRSRRAVVASALGVWDRVRALWSRVPEARARGYTAATFSFGGAGSSGACSVCRGLGERRLDRGLLADLWIGCEECQGLRFRADVLEVRWRGLSIAELLDLELEAAASFCAEQPALARALEPARRIGLGHLRLGQSLHSLSGGELQRLKLAPALGATPSARPLLIVLDEPSQGLHPVDVAGLGDSLSYLAQRGHAVAMVEHDPLLLWRAHEVCDLGPGGGKHGGRMLFRGSPQELAEQTAEERGGATADALRRARARAAGAGARADAGKSEADGSIVAPAKKKRAERRR
ncbi:MAG: hypothetical protein IPN34_03825 [Planctomycetes bacterium]|nr:hypothetical protein [Planctomycetota bacterium]